jgi:hypothetical protein
MRLSRRFLSISAAMALAATGLTMAATPAAFADTNTENFDAFTLGSPDGQSGWQADGSAGAGCATYDHAIVANPGIAGFGTNSLRMSNAVTSGCFGDQTFSNSLVDEAGETGAANDGMSGGTRQSHFEAEWQFASTDPSAEQPGLSVVASPDRGDGARMSWIQMTDTPTGLAVNFNDYRDEHVVGGTLGDANGCAVNDKFFQTTIASGLDRTAAHTIKVTMDFIAGERNDVVRVWVDSTLVHVDTSWEDYFRYCEGNPTRTVDSILFRTAGAAAPATAGNGFLIDNLTITSGPTTTADSAGTWTLSPAQSVATSTTTATTTAYQAKVRAPINADGSSNYPKKRGVIPVQFDLESAIRTVVTTTTTTGPVHFESILSDVDTSNDFSFLRFVPTTPMAFADLNELVVDYAYSAGNCGVGSLRWQIRLDVGNDGAEANDKTVFIYFGDVPSFTDCTGAESNTGENLIGSSEARFDLLQLGGPFYGTYADALAMVGGTNVLRASLVIDSGSSPDNVVDLTGASVDGNAWVPLPVGSVTNVTSDTTTPFAKTCALPQAKLQWSKDDANPDGAINEAESVQPKDTGLYYRNVDCKYIYNLDVSSLTGAGTYRVWVNIDGTNVPTPAKFDLR